MSTSDSAMMNASCEEYCAKPPIFAVWALYALMALSYATGGFMVLLSAAFVALVSWGGMREPAWGFLPDFADVARGLPITACGVLLLVTGRLSQGAIRAGKGMSLKVDACAIYVTDRRGRRYRAGFAEIDQLEARKSRWLAPRIYAVLTSGRQFLLPQRIRDPDALIAEITERAGLDACHREGRWEVYHRS